MLGILGSSLKSRQECLVLCGGDHGGPQRGEDHGGTKHGGGQGQGGLSVEGTMGRVGFSAGGNSIEKSQVEFIATFVEKIMME